MRGKSSTGKKTTSVKMDSATTDIARLLRVVAIKTLSVFIKPPPSTFLYFGPNCVVTCIKYMDIIVYICSNGKLVFKNLN